MTHPDLPGAGPTDALSARLTGPVHLPSLNDAERPDLLEQLRPWVVLLVRRFHIGSRVIPPCWERHNGMVEALLALRDLERDCYSHQAPPSAAVDWFRGYREIEARLTELAALTACTPREHRTPTTDWPAPEPNSRQQPPNPVGAPPTA